MHKPLDPDEATEDRNIFLSWSGKRSREAASAFYAWIKDSQSVAAPWLSKHDMKAGLPWFTQVTTKLSRLKVGIVFLTPENETSPWPIFEAGAICSHLGDQGRTFVILVKHAGEGLPPTHPLSHLHYVRDDEEGFRDIFKQLSQVLNQHPQDDRMVEAAFSATWPNLKTKLDAIEAKGPAASASKEMEIPTELYDIMNKYVESQDTTSNAITNVSAAAKRALEQTGRSIEQTSTVMETNKRLLTLLERVVLTLDKKSTSPRKSSAGRGLIAARRSSTSDGRRATQRKQSAAKRSPRK